MLQSKFIKQATHPPRDTTTIPNQPENALPTTWRSLPYMQVISEPEASRLYIFYVKIAHKPHSALRSNLVHVPTLQRRKVIYQIPCSGCEKTYTWQTGRRLGTRPKDPWGSIRRHDTNLCLALHCMDTCHTFNWQDTRILVSANSQRASEANEDLHSGDHFMQLDPCYRSIR